MEIWQNVKGFESLYKVSTYGRVKSLGNGKSTNSENKKERILKTNYSSLRLECDEFGWEEGSYNDAQTKLSYVLTGIQYYVTLPEFPNKPEDISWDEWDVHPTKVTYEKEVTNIIKENKYIVWIKDVLKEFGIKYYPETLEPRNKYSEFGYIDHQSTDVLEDVFSNDESEFKEKFKDFVFNPNSYLTTGNDNN
jgi:hypothetical protein